MPRNPKLTWQPGADGRTGRWRRKYKKKVYYFPGGRGKSDRQAYDAALAEWEKLKLRIDAEAPKPHQADYERAILEWEAILTWCRKHGDEEMAETAVSKLDLFRKGLSSPKPRPVATEDTFAGQFDRTVRYPKWEEAFESIAKLAEEAMQSADTSYLDGIPGSEQYLAASKEFFDSLPRSANRTVVIPNPDAWDGLDPLKIERAVWRDRLEVMDRTAAPADKALQAHVEWFLKDKEATVAAGDLSAGRIYTLRLHLTHFMDWLGPGTPVIEISSKTLSDYRVELLKNVETNEWSRPTAKDRLGSVKSFVRWLWQVEAIPLLPRILDAKSKLLEISRPSPGIVTYTKDEIDTLLTSASKRTKLYVLLALNCGMTQKDISDLQMSEVDWEAGRITRKRSKTRDYDSVPEVSYPLWQETLHLLAQDRNPADSGPVLLNANGRPLWYEEVTDDGQLQKIDNVRSAFDRLRRKVKITKPFKSLKKTSASLIRNNKEYASLEGLFLGHAPQSMAQRHYAKAPQVLLDSAIAWLAEEYDVK